MSTSLRCMNDSGVVRYCATLPATGMVRIGSCALTELMIKVYQRKVPKLW